MSNAAIFGSVAANRQKQQQDRQQQQQQHLQIDSHSASSASRSPSHTPSVSKAHLRDATIFGTRHSVQSGAPVAQPGASSAVSEEAAADVHATRSSKQMLVHEDTLERDEDAATHDPNLEIKGGAPLQQSTVDTAARQIVEKPVVSLQDRVKYVYDCLRSVNSGLQPDSKGAGSIDALTNDARSPNENLAYALHSVHAKSSRLSKSSHATTDLDRLMIDRETAEENERSRFEQQSQAGSTAAMHDADEHHTVVLEDVRKDSNAGASNARAKHDKSNDDRYDDETMADFEQRLEYTYQLLRQLEQHKLLKSSSQASAKPQQQTPRFRSDASEAAQTHTSHDDDNLAYEEALRQTKRAIAQVAKAQAAKKQIKAKL